jgi:hypothetical protein
MSIPLFFNKIALRSTINDDSVSFVEEDISGNLSIHSGSGLTKLNGDIEFEDGDGFTNLKTKIDELEAAGGIGFETTPIQGSSDGMTSGGVYDAISNIDLSTKQDKINHNSNIPGVILTKLSEKQDLLDGQSEIKVRKLEMNGTYGLDMEYQTISGNTIYLSTENLYYKNSSSQDTKLNTTLDGLQSAIDGIDIFGKQDTIIDNSLRISHVNNLQTQLDGKSQIFH